MLAKDYALCLALCNAVLESEGRSYAAIVLKAEAQLLLGDFDGAQSSFEAALAFPR